MRVAVTGASGFVGRALADWLISRGHSVIGVTRGGRPADPRVTTRTITGLDDAEGLRRAFDTADVVVHLAARVHAAPLAECRRINVDGTRVAHAAARDAGVRRFVLLSSVRAMGAGRVLPYREADLPDPVDPYGVSKLEAEQALGDARSAGGVPYSVLRATAVYGPGVGGNMRRLIRLAEIAGFMPLPLAHISNRRSLTSVRNLASAIETVAAHPGGADRRYLLSDGDDLSTSDMIARIADGIGRRARLLPCPTGLLRAMAGALGRRSEAERLLGSLIVDSSSMRTELGWHPPQTAVEALTQIGAWWRDSRQSRRGR